MTQNFIIRKAAVLGAGVMGAQIAAHLTNAGVQTILYDLASENMPNAIVLSSLKALKQLKPPPLGVVDLEKQIIPANYTTDLERLKDCDLIIEAIAEKFDFKQQLYEKIIPYLNERTILTTNTSGLSIQKLSEILPEALQSRFLGMHFFNPPRYMKLVELIPHAKTQLALFTQLENFLKMRLGKGVVYAKDTPNFIANRIGVFSLLSTLHHAAVLRIAPDRVDSLTGSLIGRAKSATFRTMDIVGLDTLQHVVQTLKDQLPQDPFHFLFEIPQWIKDLIAKGALGQKTKKGIYKKDAQLMVWDEHDKIYRPVDSHLDGEVVTVLKEKDFRVRFEKIAHSTHPELQFIWNINRDLFQYCALHLHTIAHTTEDIDSCMRWGYGWEYGPFEIWQMAGFNEVAQYIQRDIDAGSALTTQPLPVGILATRKKQTQKKEQILFETPDVKLWTEKEPIPILSFKTKRAVISMGVLQGIQEAIARCEKDFKALVLWQPYPDFSLGANLKEVVQYSSNQQWNKIEEFVTEFQKTALRLRYAQIPTIVAISGLTLGGGCEFSLHATRRVATFETYIGLVEVGVGIIPAGGGSKELALRASKEGGWSVLKRYFEQIAMAQTSTSALDARRLGYLSPGDRIIFNTDLLLDNALQEANALANAAYFPHSSCVPFSVAGKTGIANLQTYLINLREGQFISEHDYLIGLKLAHVLCGGTVEAGSAVSEDYMLRLEREAILELARLPQTAERIAYTLETGKILRN